MKTLKHLILLLAFSLLTCMYVAAQHGNGNGNGGSGSGGSGSGHHGSQANNSPWAGVNIPQSWKNWLEHGGNMPGDLRNRILSLAGSWGMQTFGLSVNQMKQHYNQGTLTITYVATAPPSLTFRVRYANLDVVIIDSF